MHRHLNHHLSRSRTKAGLVSLYLNALFESSQLSYTLVPSRRSSQQELGSPVDSIQFVISPTSLVGEETGDLETRGKELANRCWDENDHFLPKEKIAEWLGGQYAEHLQRWHNF